MAINETIREALDLRNLKLPGSPRVIELTVDDYTDMDGEESLRVTVVIDDQTNLDQVSGKDVGELKAAIRRSLEVHGIELFPYIFFAKPSELAVEEQDA